MELPVEAYVWLIGIPVIAAVGGVVVFKRSKKAEWKARLPLAATVLVIIPVVLLSLAIEDALDALHEFLEYPKVVDRAFAEHEPATSQCTDFKYEVRNVTATYEIPDVSNVTDRVDEYKVAFIYAGALVVVAALAGIATARCGPKRFADILSSVVLLLYLTVVIALAVVISVGCTEYLDKSKLDGEVRWFVDTSAEVSAQPWFDNITAFLDDCFNSSSDAIQRAVNPGALADSYDSLKTAVCTRCVNALYGKGGVVVAAYLGFLGALWLSAW